MIARVDSLTIPGFWVVSKIVWISYLPFGQQNGWSMAATASSS